MFGVEDHKYYYYQNYLDENIKGNLANKIIKCQEDRIFNVILLLAVVVLCGCSGKWNWIHWIEILVWFVVTGIKKG